MLSVAGSASKHEIDAVMQAAAKTDAEGASDEAGAGVGAKQSDMADVKLEGAVSPCSDCGWIASTSPCTLPAVHRLLATCT